MGRETVETTNPMMTMSREDLIAILSSLKPDPEEQAKVLARAQEMARPEARSNPTSPQISYRNPYGERDHPRPRLRTAFTWNDGITFEQDQETWELIELLNALEPGAYMVSCADGSRLPFKVVAHTDDLGGVNRVNITLKCDNEHKDRLRGFAEMCREVLGPKAKDILTMAEHEQRAKYGVGPDAKAVA